MKKKIACKLIVFTICLILTAGIVVLPVSASDGFDAKHYDITGQELTNGEIVRLYDSSDNYKQKDHTGGKGGSLGYVGHYTDVFFGPSLFCTPSTQLCMQDISDENTANHNFALLGAALSSAAYNDILIAQAYMDLGCAKEDIFLYSYPDSEFNRKDALKGEKKFANDGSLSFSVASRNMTIDGTETDLVFITLCGTHNLNEIFQDKTMKCEKNFYGYYAWDWVYEFQEDVFAGLEDYKSEHPNLGKRPMKIVINGHSLAGGGANLVAARFNYTCDSIEWYADAVTQDDIYCYTYGGLDSVSDTKKDAPEYHKEIPVLNGFDNIINIYNMLDNFGPEGKIAGLSLLSSQQVYGKFGHFYTFRDSMDDYVENSAWQQHEICGYLEAVENGLLDNFTAEERIRVRITGPVDVQLFRGTARAGEIKGNQVSLYEEDLYAVSEDGIRTIILPKDKGYRVKLVGTGEGSANYILERVSCTKPVSVVYRDFQVEEGKRIETEFMVSFAETDISMFVLGENGEQIALIHRDGTEESLIEEEEEEESYGPGIEQKHGRGPSEEDKDESRKTWILIIFSGAAALLVAGAVVTTVVAIKKNRK